MKTKTKTARTRTPEEQEFFDYYGIELWNVDWEKAEAEGTHRMTKAEVAKAATEDAPAFLTFVRNGLREADKAERLA